MPALAAGVEEAKLARWLKREGDVVAAGECLAEIETDKAAMEMPAEIGGVLDKILVGEGDTVPVNTVIGILLMSADDQEPHASNAGAGPTPTETTAADDALATAGLSRHTAIGGYRTPASPLARRVAEELGVRIENTNGSGPGGRVVRRDVELAHRTSARPLSVDTVSPTAMPPQPALSGFTSIPNSTLRRAVARRLTESKTTIPHFYLEAQCEIDELLVLRTTLNRQGSAQTLSINDFVIKAAALALKAVPQANAAWTEDAIRLFDDVDISIAVALDEGLITPVIRKADSKPILAISQEMSSLVERARARALVPAEYQGGGFTISNLGMYGVESFLAIINPPQSCILAIGTATRRPVVRGESCVPATIMSCTLSVDHRSVDGVVGARYLSAFKALIQQPQQLLMDA